MSEDEQGTQSEPEPEQPTEEGEEEEHGGSSTDDEPGTEDEDE